ncbi:Asp23/Gls24 family envelope stress response protein [Streptomyces liangshanensis]|uniref:hypothetical protein n=1 Tax=Streptomyces liangshanensis TaxID=2717324 RepID=UPI0036DEF0FD
MAGDQVVAAERGVTTIADRVVAKIAARAAREALDRVPEGGEAPHASVTLHHGAARVRVGVELDYPSDIGARCGAVRQRVSQRVHGLAGVEVAEVVVQVERLHSVHTRGADGGRIR